jgi:hypothetical protein
MKLLAEIGIEGKLHHSNASKESFSSPLRDLGSELMLYSDIVTIRRLRMVVNHETSKIPRLCRDVFARYGGNDAWNVSAHYVYRKIIFFLKSMFERQVLLADTIIRDLPRLRDTEAISRDSCHGVQARWYRGLYEGILQRFYT